MFIHMINFWVIVYVFFVNVSNVGGSSSNNENEKISLSLQNYTPSPYHLEDYCTDEENEVEFIIDSWKGAIFHLGESANPDDLSRTIKIHKCKVNIKTHKDFGLTAAIENMEIRGNRDTSNRWHCTDYVQFSSPPQSTINKFLSVFELDDIFNSKKSEKLCGEKQLDSEHLESIFDLSTDANSFSTATHKMTLLFHQDYDERHTAANSFTVIVTSFRHSSDEVKCEEKQKCYGRRESYCIDKKFICDGHVNCAFPGSGTDERLCTDDEKQKTFNVTSIIIIALISIVSLGIVVCIVSTIICKLKSRYVDGGGRTHNPAVASISLAPYPNTSERETDSSLHLYESNLPAYYSDTKGSLGTDSDLPPKYEALFPGGGPLVSSDTKEDPPDKIKP